jgi:uncharacterized protein
MADRRLRVPLPTGASNARLFSSAAGQHLLVIPFSRIYDVAPGDSELLDAESAAATLLERGPDEVDLEIVPEPSPQCISLNVSSSCNLSCGYCYAARGAFGGAQTSPMEWATAQAAIDRLIAGADASAPVTIGFMGGEPFVNRKLIHRAVAYGAAEAARRGLDIRYSVTTNGTLLEADDIDMMRRHPFAVTVSLDGGASVQDRARPRWSDKAGTFESIVERVKPLLSRPGLARVAARATVTRDHFELQARLDALLGLGFPEVGFSPLRVGPHGSGALRDEDWPEYLAALVAVARLELERYKCGMPIRLTNFAVALKQIHRGASLPYPCGAGGGYFSVSAQGRWYACHRAIGDPDFELGSNEGLDAGRRRSFLASRHVHAQTDCSSCWARYLCSGGCHQEAKARTAASCTFIRGWLDFCLAAYCELDNSASSAAPLFPTTSRVEAITP